jgi:hypothetical protein
LRLSTLIVATILSCAPAQAQGSASSPLPSHLPLRVEACFGRTYDSAHLARHPKQRVTSLHLLRDFSPDPNTEREPASREEMLKQDGDNGYVNVMAYVRLRDRKGLFWNGLTCRRDEKGLVRCGVECDGGGFRLRPAGDGLTLDNDGFVAMGGCGASEDEDERTEFVNPGADDKNFRLDRRPIAECAALREAERPAWAKLGTPLRVRFNRNEAVCFARQYGAAHLARHPQQKVRRIAVLKDQGVTLKPDDALIYPLTIRVELSDGRRIERRTRCAPDTYALGCTLDEQSDSMSGFHLTRAGDQHMMVRDGKGRLGKFLGATLGADDRMFKLQSEPAGVCAF